MNYRHAYHAGNHADVLKHIVLARIFALMARKDTPFAYLDSHSGIGLYDLLGDEASRTGEWESGIGRLYGRHDLPELVQDYLGVVSALNPDGGLEFYPGSPELGRRLTRPQDRVMLNELHPEDGRLLKANMAGERRIAVHQGDGWLLPRAFLPVPEKRGVLLIDPPFEQPDDLERCVTALDEAIGRMRQTVVAIWYPIKDRRQLKRFYQRLEKSSAPKLLRVELCVHPADTADRLNGSGLVIANPPWPLDEELCGLLPWLAETLAQSEGSSQVDWLIAE
ncbi:23S rRNA (adenine(2030)-N(6))-methyltransferase RlmJ [Pseudomonas nitroreducens]|uniref:23S rRNA (adenine(2030)-N(6))-methyltransferase RlmJ n=1 Tax=Pseudomonas TaxID=286 RepID=UPI00031B5E85|nr:23S rRNA (adenine(2030)-N(6))-methyltransferase RlmJ [Pseudomonas nitroreducens]